MIQKTDKIMKKALGYLTHDNKSHPIGVKYYFGNYSKTIIDFRI